MESESNVPQGPDLWLTQDRHLTELTVNRYRTGEGPQALIELVEQHVQTCARCRDALADLEAFEADLELPPFSALLEQTERPVKEAVAPDDSGRYTQKAAAQHQTAAVIPFRRRRMPMVATLSTLAAAAAVVLMFRFGGEPDGSSSETVKPLDPITVTQQGGLGDEPDTLRRKGREFELAVLVEGESGAVVPVDTEQSVHPGDRIGFRVYPRRAGNLMIVGTDEAGSTYKCYPQDARGKSTPVDAVGGAQDLQAAMRLDDVLGRERIVGLLCPTSFDYAEIEQRLRGLAAGGALPDPLPLLREGCLQHEVLLRKTPRPEG